MGHKNRFEELSLLGAIDKLVQSLPNDILDSGPESGVIDPIELNNIDWNTWMDALAGCPKGEEDEVIGELAELNKELVKLKSRK